VPDHLERHLSACSRERHALVGSIRNEAHLGELLQRLRNGGRRDIRGLGDVRSGDRLVFLKLEDGLDVVLLGLAQLAHGALGMVVGTLKIRHRCYPEAKNCFHYLFLYLALAKLWSTQEGIHD